MKTRLFKNYATTILGLLLMLGAGYLAVIEKDNVSICFSIFFYIIIYFVYKCFLL